MAEGHTLMLEAGVASGASCGAAIFWERGGSGDPILCCLIITFETPIAYVCRSVHGSS